ncbi:protein telomere ends associated-like [Teleopsis dalmanni]|nr:protein telomere ends associated-like [Teleopsis dalmanni]
MPPRKRKNVKQTKITDTMGIKTKKAQTSPKPKEDISLQEKPREELKTRSVFPVTIDEFIENTNIIDLIKDYIKDKYSTALETYLTEPEIMSRVKNTYNVFYKRPQRRCMAPMKYVRITSDCDENTKQRLFKIPEYYKHLCENKDNEHQSVKQSLKKQDSSPDKNINSVSDKKILEEKILGLKSIISNFDANNKETNEKVCNLPVSFETFKRFTFHNDVIDNICQSIKELEYELPISNISKEELFDNNKLLRSYYKTFYMQTVIRTIFPLKIKPCPGRLKDKLLKYPEITSDHEEPTVSNRDAINANTKEHLNKKTKLGSMKEDKNMEKCSLALEIKAPEDNAVEKSLLHHQKQNMPKTLSPTPCRAQMKAKPLTFPNKIFNVDSDSTTSNDNDEIFEGSANVTVVERIDQDNAVEKSMIHQQNQKTPKSKVLPFPNKNVGSDNDSTNSDENEEDIINVPVVKPIGNKTKLNQSNENANQHVTNLQKETKTPESSPLINVSLQTRDTLDESKQKRLQQTITHDDSKYVLKFQDFVKSTNILDLLRNSSDSTDDYLVNLAYEYYIKFVTNPVNPNVELFKDLMIHANEKSVKSFYTIYTQNKKDSSKEVKAIEDM